MTDFKLSQLTAATPASADLIPFVDVDDTSTPPAGAGGSDKAVTAVNLATALATLAPSLSPAGVRSVSTNYAATGSDFLIECTAALTVTLPVAAIPAGLLLLIKKTGSGNITIAPATGTIDGAASILLVNANDVVLAQWDGTTWIVAGGTRVPGWLSASSGIHSGGVLTSGSNTLDDGSGNVTIAGTASAPEWSASGLTGATAASRYVGATSSGSPGSGTFVTGDFAIDRTGKVWVCTSGGSPGTWVQDGVSIDGTAAHFNPDGVASAGVQTVAAASDHVHPEKGAQSLLLAPAASGALAETMPRLFATAAISTSSGTTRAVAIALPKGLVVTNITFCTGNTAETGGSHGWYGLLDNTAKVLAVSADQAGATFWTSASAITLAMGSPYTVLAAGIFYIAVSVTATQVPNFTGFSYSAQQTINLSPILAATAGTHNAPPSVGTTLTLSSDNALYGYVS